jgi:predicted DNA-binding transcriptional regulator AlpA
MEKVPMQTFTSDDQLIASAALREKLGGISPMTLWRWEQSRAFPQAHRIGPRKFWKMSEILAWVERQSPMNQS